MEIRERSFVTAEEVAKLAGVSRSAVSRTFTDREPLASDGYDAMVAAQSRLLERLADSIAVGLR